MKKQYKYSPEDKRRYTLHKHIKSRVDIDSHGRTLYMVRGLVESEAYNTIKKYVDELVTKFNYTIKIK